MSHPEPAQVPKAPKVYQIPGQRIPSLVGSVPNSTTAIFPRSVLLCASGLSSPCCSWRHAQSVCARWRRHQDYSRVYHVLQEAPDGWLYVVLTFGAPQAWSAAVRAFQRLWRRIRRRFGPAGRFILSWEETSQGVPHANLLISGVQAGRLTGFLQDAVVPCGWGPRFYCEPVQDLQWIANYEVKLTQAPYSAPLRFRRILSSQKLLPERRYRRVRVPGRRSKPTEGVI